jgi:hypothetical protein
LKSGKAPDVAASYIEAWQRGKRVFKDPLTQSTMPFWTISDAAALNVSNHLGTGDGESCTGHGINHIMSYALSLKVRKTAMLVQSEKWEEGLKIYERCHQIAVCELTLAFSMHVTFFFFFSCSMVPKLLHKLIQRQLP